MRSRILSARSLAVALVAASTSIASLRAARNEAKSFSASVAGAVCTLEIDFRSAPRVKEVISGSSELYVLDFDKAIFRDTRKRLRPESRWIEYAVLSQYDRDTVRLVVKRPTASRISHRVRGSRVEVVVSHPGAGLRPGEKLAEASASKVDTSKAPPSIDPYLLQTRSRGKKPRVVIDPGHGGKDPGAVGPHTTDKEIALSVALEIQKLMAKDDRFEVSFTRTQDRFVGLEERAELARRVGADLFVSLHANAAPFRQARGYEVWYLSNKGSREEARRVLTEAPTPKAIAANPATKLIRSIVVDSRRENTLNQSSLLAGFMNQSLAKTGQRSRGVGGGNYVVLRSVEVPSVLIELGFLTNPREEKLLMSKGHQAKQAKAIVQGITAYLQSQGKIGEGMNTNAIYAVRRNDSLSTISKRFEVDLEDLAEANGLKSNSPIFVGQLLTIPTDPIVALLGELGE